MQNALHSTEIELLAAIDQIRPMAVAANAKSVSSLNEYLAVRGREWANKFQTLNRRNSNEYFYLLLPGDVCLPVDGPYIFLFPSQGAAAIGLGGVRVRVRRLRLASEKRKERRGQRPPFAAASAAAAAAVT